MKENTHDLNHILTFSAHTINCVWHSIRPMFRVLGIHNFAFNLNLFTGRYPWSDRGFSGPQPEGNGDCLAILNNVYNDRVKYHDVACHHTKPTICECP